MVNYIDRHVGRRLAELRADAGVSQVSLARALGVSVAEVQAFEAGHTRVSAAQLNAACIHLGAEIADLFEGLTSATLH